MREKAAGHRVAIVVGSGFAADVRRIARDCHVWALRTPEYERVADDDWRTSSGHSLERGVTLFGGDEASPEAVLTSIFGTVHEHHGEHSHDPPLDEVEVLGAQPTDEVRAELSAFGFVEIAPSARGFVVSRT
jgi:hypothetical protein